MSTENPYQPVIDGRDTSKPAPFQRNVWIAVAASAALSPLALSSLQRVAEIPNISYLFVSFIPVALAIILLQGGARLWGALMGIVVFAKFVILAAVIDFLLYGFDGVH